VSERKPSIPGRGRGNPNMRKGGPSVNPRGRPPGILDMRMRLQQAACAAGLMPLDVLIAVAKKDPEVLAKIGLTPKRVTPALQVRAAESAAPYVHQRMPARLDIGTGSSDDPIEVAARLEREGRLERALHIGLLRLRAPQPEVIDATPAERERAGG